MCQVNPSKVSKDNTTILCFCMLKQCIIFSRHTKKSQLFGTRHATTIITKNRVKKHLACHAKKSKSQSMQAPLALSSGNFLLISNTKQLICKTTQRERGSKL